MHIFDAVIMLMWSGRVRLPFQGLIHWLPMASYEDDWVETTVSRHMSLHGGRSHKTWLLPTNHEVIMEDEKILTFVSIRKDLDWMYKSVVGPSAKKGSLSSVNIISELRGKVAAAMNGYRDGLDEPAAAVAADDSVSLLDDASDSYNIALHTAPKKRRMRPPARRYQFKLARDRVCTITLPEHEPTRHPELTDHTRDVTLLQGIRGGEIAIAHEDVPWLLRWINAELSGPESAVAADSLA